MFGLELGLELAEIRVNTCSDQTTIWTSELDPVQGLTIYSQPDASGVVRNCQWWGWAGLRGCHWGCGAKPTDAGGLRTKLQLPEVRVPEAELPALGDFCNFSKKKFIFMHISAKILILKQQLIKVQFCSVRINVTKHDVTFTTKGGSKPHSLSRGYATA